VNRRIFGLETEYGVVVVPQKGHDAGEQVPTAEQAVKLMFEATPNAFRTTNHFLPNGGRLYVDIGSHPEYASAECDHLGDLVANDRAGDHMVQNLADIANTRLTERGVGAGIHIMRNNADSFGNTFGCHENYSAARDIDFERYLRTLTALLVTRPILTGCGDVVTEPDGTARFVVSSRSEHIATTASADPTKNRPLVNTKDEPHADRSRWRRLHVISGDSSMIETTTALKVGWTALVLDLIENGGSIDDLVPQDPIAAMRIVNRDIRGRATFFTEGGRAMGAVDVQREILERVLNRVEPGDTRSTWVLDLVTRSLDAIAAEDLGPVSTELDWVLVWHLLQRHRERTGADWSDPRLARLILSFHDLSARTGLRDRLHAAGAASTFCTSEELEAARTTAPATTRARVRGEFLGWAAQHRFRATADWGHVRLDKPTRSQIDLPDPFVNHSDEVQALFEELS
jgi:proteasome accessory factor A